MSREERRAACNVQSARWLQAGDHLHQPLDLLLPTGALARLEQARAQPPVVVLGSAPLVIGLLVGAHSYSYPSSSFSRFTRSSSTGCAPTIRVGRTSSTPSSASKSRSSVLSPSSSTMRHPVRSASFRSM